ncbi:DNA replication and repair protein RecN [Pseudonocardia thermophila]|uniref:DNA repair protein RecN n=2 Tax=Pseudonocardia thermophila TaxID=1848 RepID=A0A1M6SWT8_PSETH|nr:DNA replication and repair protein RecN [Pseudonocardia thermophila]
MPGRVTDVSVRVRTLRPMLAEMRIQGLGVIDDATLELDPGLTVLTGETGAGKTMVVTGLTLLGGGRADPSRVATGAERAVVEGRFTVDEEVQELADEVGAEVDDGELIAVRTVGADGRSRAHLGGRSVPVGVLSRLAEATLVVHGQNDQLRLLRPAEQRALLDRFAGPPVLEPLARYREVRAEWQKTITELAERRDGARRMAQEADMLRLGLSEIEAVDPQPGEDVELVDLAKRLAAADDLRSVAAAAQAALVGGVEGSDPDHPDAMALVGEARHRLSGAGDPELAALDARLGEVVALLGDVGAELAGYLDRLDADPERLSQVLSRQAELKTLTRKYAADIDGVLAWAVEARRRLERLDTSDEALAALAARRDELAAELARHAAAVTAARTKAAETLAKATTAELAGLAMPDARLEVVVTPRSAEPGAADVLEIDGAPLVAGADGVDEVELRLVAHGGAQPQPLHKGASGGELSRVMLALEVALAGTDPVPTMVFDEVDAGVGGRAAVEIGRRLARLATRHQVIVVTHLPQVAAYADRHLVVDKQRGPKTRSRVRALAEEERITELARMLAGLDDTDTGRAHAEELLETARAHRAADRSRSATRRKAATSR